MELYMASNKNSAMIATWTLSLSKMNELYIEDNLKI